MIGVILVVSLPFIPEAFVDLVSIAIGVIAFLVIMLFKVDVALVAVGAMRDGIAYAAVPPWWAAVEVDADHMRRVEGPC